MSGLWVLSGPGIPCGARKLGNAPLGESSGDRVWLDMCMLGQHLPQMYRLAEVHELTAAECAGLGLCEVCLGFGDLGQNLAKLEELARRIDEVGNPCPACGGSGRPAVRSTASRDEVTGSITGGIRFVPHEYVPPRDMDANLVMLFEVPEDMCLACGNGRDFEWNGRPLHTEAVVT